MHASLALPSDGRLMPLHVQRQMIRSGEGSLTQLTFEWLLTCVFSVVSGQFVGPGKLPSTALPCACVWLLTWNTTQYYTLTYTQSSESNKNARY
ncbi:hypothetical protein CEXT_636301 [Caerostris extrusa]|uniref:Uncharacterized protein n=1 Tax=Caerostris extrusa TaxID=172846 RepID=A0AAV4RM27_CAEEX|nr:hypothetical protein CEXT_636301 [Caerostris extrusa]